MNRQLGLTSVNDLPPLRESQQQLQFRDSMQSQMLRSVHPPSMAPPPPVVVSMGAAQTRQAKCKDHSDEVYRNFCCDPDCMKPLCPECIPQHHQYHKSNGSEPMIQSLKFMQSTCKEKLAVIKGDLDQLYDQIEYVGHNQHVLDDSDKGIKRILEYQSIFIEAVNEYFDSLLNKYRTRLNTLNTKEDQAKKIQDKLMNLFEQLDLLHLKLDEPQIDVIQEITTLDYSPDLNDIKASILEIENAHQIYSIDVIAEDTKIRNLKNDLRTYVRLGSYYANASNNNSMHSQNNSNNIHQNSQDFSYSKNVATIGEQLIQQQQLPSSSQRIPANPNLMMSSQSLPLNIRAAKTIVNFDVVDIDLIGPSKTQKELTIPEDANEYFAKHNESALNDDQQPIQFEIDNDSQVQPELPISTPSYFENSCPHKYLPYFSASTKCLYLIDVNHAISTSLSSQSPSPSPSSSAQSLKSYAISEPIAEFHRILITPRGEVFTLGGVFKNIETNKVHKFDYTSHKFIEQHPMINTRSSFPALFADKSLFVIGGKRSSAASSECERYDIASNKWTSIASLNFACYASSICMFNKRYIYKYGGIGPAQQENNNHIEKYDTNRNTWEVISLLHQDIATGNIHPLDQRFILFFNCASLQINNQSMFVFGGQFKQNTTTSTFCLDIQPQIGEQLSSHHKKQMTKSNSDNNHPHHDNHIINSFDYIPIPTPGSFSTNPIIHNDTIIALQNLDHMHHNSLHNSQKRILTFNGFKWTANTLSFQ